MYAVGRGERVGADVVDPRETGHREDVENPQVKQDDVHQKKQTGQREHAEKCPWTPRG